MKKRTLIILSIVCAIAVTALRIISYQSYFDGTFFTDILLSTVAPIVVCLMPLAFGFIWNYKNKRIIYKYNDANYINQGIVEILCTVSFGYLCYCMWIKEINSFLYPLHDSNIMGVSFRLPFFILSILMFVYLLIITIFHLANKNCILKKAPVVGIVPLIWAVSYVVYAYIHFSNSLILVENFFALFCPMSVAMVLIRSTKIFLDIDEENIAFKKSYTFLGLALCVNSSYFVSNIIMEFMEIGNKSQLSLDLQLVSFVICIYILNFLSSTNFATEKRKAPSFKESENKKTKTYRGKHF